MFDNGPEPDHRVQLRDSVKDFVSRSVSSKQVREDLASSDGFSRVRWKQFADLGWTSVILPEDYGGLGMEPGDLAALHHEIGRGALPEPLGVVPLLVVQALANGDNEDLANRLIPELVAADRIASLAWQESAGAIEAEDVGPRAEPCADGWRLTGKASFISSATSATGLLVAAKTGLGTALFWIDEMPALRGGIKHADGSAQASVGFDGIVVGAGALVVGPERGREVLHATLDMARLAASAELLGLMERAFEMTMDYLRQRHQFGKPIGSFQALQHRSVNLFIQIELARSAVGRAARAMDRGEAEREAQVSAAKSRCGEAALLVIKDCIQMHGAIAYTSEYDLSLYVNRVLFLSGWLGNARVHRSRWSKLANAGTGHDH